MDQTNGVIDFITGWKALVQTPTGQDRVRRLLEGFRSIRRRSVASEPKKRELPSVEVVERLFKGLSAPLSSARSAGSFIDVWSIAGLRRRELPNAAVLAWLIDPNGSHGQGTLCLAALLDIASQRAALDFPRNSLAVARVQTEERPLGSDRDRVDIVVETPELLTFIEVKIDATEGEAQLTRYLESASRVAAARSGGHPDGPKPTHTIFLSPRPPVEALPQVSHITWRELAHALMAAAKTADGFAGLLIRSFANHARSFG